MALIPRKPDINHPKSPVVWSVIPEFSQYWNGASIIIPYIEHYLVNIIGQVRDKVGKKNPALDEDMLLFVKQETNHSSYHLQFNKRMYDAGYDELHAIIEQMKGELKTLRETKSLAFNIAYCAGFENAALFAAKYLFERADDLFEGADVRGADMFLWHVAEEFEHRAVCHDAFNAVSGSYFMRIYGLIYAFLHVGGSFTRAARLIMDRDQARMSEADRLASRRREKKLFWRQIRYILPRAMVLFLPWYDPSMHKTPPRVQAALDFYNSFDPMAERFGFKVSGTGRL